VFQNRGHGASIILCGCTGCPGVLDGPRRQRAGRGVPHNDAGRGLVEPELLSELILGSKVPCSSPWYRRTMARSATRIPERRPLAAYATDRASARAPPAAKFATSLEFVATSTPYCTRDCRSAHHSFSGAGRMLALGKSCTSPERAELAAGGLRQRVYTRCMAVWVSAPPRRWPLGSKLIQAEMARSGAMPPCRLRAAIGQADRRARR
jgi:hypothetical protein